ncbi:MAG: dihydropteroate synthase [Bacteroidales bacterium]|nr:dihydropteroate synthase [Bacteroidales bacterium]
MIEKSIFIMGILNNTPNSFYDGGFHAGEKALLAKAEKMISEGADIIDIGGFSTKPNCEIVSEAEERHRVIPLVRTIKNLFPDIMISVDTFRSNIAEASIEAGATIINDISGSQFDEKIIDVVARCKQVLYVMMHCAESIDKMHNMNHEGEDITEVVKRFFEEKLFLFQSKGIENKRIILDPGFGFGKTIPQNYQLLRYLNTFAKMGDTLAGLSRKSMIYKTLKITPQEALQGTVALNMIALMNGAKYLRVHDVKEAKEVVALYYAYENRNNE